MTLFNSKFCEYERNLYPMLSTLEKIVFNLILHILCKQLIEDDAIGTIMYIKKTIVQFKADPHDMNELLYISPINLLLKTEPAPHGKLKGHKLKQ